MRYPNWVYEKLTSSAAMGNAEGDLKPVIDVLVGLSEKARREGLLALEDDLDNLEDPLLKFGLLLVVDGTDPEIISAALVNCLAAVEPDRLLSAVVIIEGVLAIQEGVNPRTMRALLGAYLGADAALAAYSED